MKKILRFVGQGACLLLVAAGVLTALIATFCLLAMLIVWFQERTLHSEDRTIFAWGVKWLIASALLAGVAWWMRGKIVPKAAGDNSVRLVESKSGHSEKLVQGIFEIGFFVALALWLWDRVPGSAISRVLGVAGWLLVCLFGHHARIALHELGHLAGAWCVGFDLRKIQVGIGPRLWSRTSPNGLLCEWRAWPHGGFVLATPRNRQGFKARQSLVVAAGPLADLILLWLTYQLIIRAFGGLAAAFIQGAGGLIAFGFFWWTAFSTVGALVPHEARLGPIRVWTDGYLLLRLWTGSNLAFPELAYNSKWKDPLELLGSDGSQSVIPLEGSERALPAHPVGPLTFQERRALLNARLLRLPSITSSPPA